MKTLQWTHLQQGKPEIMSEYVINELGVFVKRENRMPKDAKLTAFTGFRVGYKPIKGTDYRAAPLDRNGILWCKITSIREEEGAFIVSGNQKDSITLYVSDEIRGQLKTYISEMIQRNSVKVEPDIQAAVWMCFRDDDDWSDPQMSLYDMIQEELETERFIDPDVLEETRLLIPREQINFGDKEATETIEKVEIQDVLPKFCSYCGVSLDEDSVFCHNCGKKLV